MRIVYDKEDYACIPVKQRRAIYDAQVRHLGAMLADMPPYYYADDRARRICVIQYTMINEANRRLRLALVKRDIKSELNGFVNRMTDVLATNLYDRAVQVPEWLALSESSGDFEALTSFEEELRPWMLRLHRLEHVNNGLSNKQREEHDRFSAIPRMHAHRGAVFDVFEASQEQEVRSDNIFHSDTIQGQDTGFQNGRILGEADMMDVVNESAPNKGSKHKTTCDPSDMAAQTSAHHMTLRSRGPA